MKSVVLSISTRLQGYRGQAGMIYCNSPSGPWALRTGREKWGHTKCQPSEELVLPETNHWDCRWFVDLKGKEMEQQGCFLRDHIHLGILWSPHGIWYLAVALKFWDYYWISLITLRLPSFYSSSKARCFLKLLKIWTFSFEKNVNFSPDLEFLFYTM